MLSIFSAFVFDSTLFIMARNLFSLVACHNAWMAVDGALAVSATKYHPTPQTVLHTNIFLSFVCG